MSTKHRIHEGFFRAKLLTGSIVLGAFLGVITYIFYLADWSDMGLIEIYRIGAYVYSRAPIHLAVAAFGGAVALGWPVWMFAWRPGAGRIGDADDKIDNLRGQRLVTVNEIKKQIRGERTKTRLEIGGVPIPLMWRTGVFCSRACLKPVNPRRLPKCSTHCRLGGIVL